MQKGSSLIEILIAIGIVGIVLTGIIVALTFSIKSTAESKYRSLATTKAQEVIEYLRRERSRLGWSQFYELINDGFYCFDEIPGFDVSIAEKQGQCGENYSLVMPGVGLNFKREAEINKNGLDDVEIIVTVSWPRFEQSADIDREVVVRQKIKNW